MDEVSNKTLATLLVVAIVISLAGTFFAMRGVSQITNIITGAATNPSGTAKVNISETTSIYLSASLVDFGVGYRNASAVNINTECNLTTNQSVKPVCWFNLTAWDPNPFVLENDGNTYVNVTINGTNVTNFLDGVVLGGVRRYQFAPSDSSEGMFLKGENGCNVTFDSTNWQEFTGSTTGPQTLCRNMSPFDAEDEFFVEVNISIPQGPTGYKEDTVTFYAVKSAQ